MAEMTRQSIAIYQSVTATCFGRPLLLLVSFKLYLLPQYDQFIFVWHFMDPRTSAKKPAPG
jgi:hypothetical protein